MMIKQLAIGSGLVLAATVAVTSPALSQTQNSQGANLRSNRNPDHGDRSRSAVRDVVRV